MKKLQYIRPEPTVITISYGHGNDLEALNRAKSRLHYALNSYDLSPWDRELCTELLTSQSLVEYESTRAAWSELAALLPPKI